MWPPWSSWSCSITSEAISPSSSMMSWQPIDVILSCNITTNCSKPHTVYTGDITPAIAPTAPYTQLASHPSEIVLTGKIVIYEHFMFYGIIQVSFKWLTVSRILKCFLEKLFKSETGYLSLVGSSDVRMTDELNMNHHPASFHQRGAWIPIACWLSLKLAFLRAFCLLM